MRDERGRRDRDKRGATTLEVVAAMAILAIIITAIAEMTVSLLRFRDVEALRAEIERRATTGIEPIREAAKGARAILATGTVNGIAYVSGTSTVAFSLPAAAASGALLGTTDLVGFRRQTPTSSILLEDVEAATGSRRITGTYVTAAFVDAFRIRYNTSTPADADLIEIFLETGASLYGREFRYPLMTRILLENR